jgi:hypothetical protein
MYDVMPVELGFMPSGGGLGGKGFSEMSENSTYRKGIRPTARWIESICNNISWNHLGMPVELTFKFEGLEVEDEAVMASTRDLELRNGSRTLNEIRAERGEAPYPMDEGDMPFIATATGIQFLEGAAKMQQEQAEATLEGAQAQTEAAKARAENPNAGPPGSQPPQSGGPAAGQANNTNTNTNTNQNTNTASRTAKKAALLDEARTFMRFAAKRSGKAWRDFEFTVVKDSAADKLNQWGAEGRIDLIHDSIEALKVA